MKDLSIYNFTMGSGLTIKGFYHYEDKIAVSFFYYSSMENKRIEEKTRKYKLYYTNKGCYFNYKGIRYYLSDFISVQE